MREAIGMQGIMYIIIILLLLFTGFLCLSINFTAAFKVTDSIVNQINKDEGVNVANISAILEETGYSAEGDCGDWKAFYVNGQQSTTNKGQFCIKRIKSNNSDNATIPQTYYYRVMTFYTIDIPLLNRLNLNVQANTSVIYSPTDEINFGN